MTTTTSGINQFNPSSLVSKTVMGLLKAKPTLAKFANSTHNRIFSEETKTYAPGTTYTLNIPTYPQIQYGTSVTPTGKSVRIATININTGSNPETSGYINCVREIDQVSEQLYLQDEDEWNRQFVKPTYEVLRGQINTFLYRQLANSVAYTVVPRFINDRGPGNEAYGRFIKGDITMYNRSLDYMCSMNMNNYQDFVFCMNSSAYYDQLNTVIGQQDSAFPIGVPSRFINQYNEEAVKEGVLGKTNGFYLYHDPYIPYHYSGTFNYIDNAGGIPAPGSNFDFVANDGLATGGNITPLQFYCAGYNETTSVPAAVNATVSTITTIPETKGFLIITIPDVTSNQTNTLTFQFNPRDTLLLSTPDITASDGVVLPLQAVDPITKKPRFESFSCNVACEDPFTVQVTGLNTTTNKSATFYVPVNFLPYGPDPIITTSGINKYNELQAIGYRQNPRLSIYNAALPNGNVLFKTIIIGGVSQTGVSLRHIGNHVKILGFSKEGLHFVNPPLADIIGADNEQVYDEKARMSVLTTIQGGVTQGTNIMRTSSLWGSGGITDNIVQILYFPNYE